MALILLNSKIWKKSKEKSNSFGKISLLKLTEYKVVAVKNTATTAIYMSELDVAQRAEFKLFIACKLFIA